MTQYSSRRQKTGPDFRETGKQWGRAACEGPQTQPAMGGGRGACSVMRRWPPGEATLAAGTRAKCSSGGVSDRRGAVAPVAWLSIVQLIDGRSNRLADENTCGNWLATARICEGSAGPKTRADRAEDCQATTVNKTMAQKRSIRIPGTGQLLHGPRHNQQKFF